MNAAVQDAYNLAWDMALVIQGRPPDTFLDSYHEERRPVRQSLLRTAGRFFSVAATRYPMLVALGNFLIPRVLPRVMEQRSLQTRTFRFIYQLGIKRLDSAIVREKPRRADRACYFGSAADHRPPDGPLPLFSDDHPISLFFRLWGTSSYLLLFNERGSVANSWDAFEAELLCLLREYKSLLEPHLTFNREPAQVSTVTPVYVDEAGIIYVRHGLQGADCYLSRAEGYVAFRTPETGLQPVRVYLHRIFPASSHVPAGTPRSCTRKEVCPWRTRL